MNEPLVSIVCEVYNHEPFLRQCLDGFVMQKTSFQFEILIHEDASTDGSALVVREYADKYPELFKPIYQTENQYSQGIHIWAVHQFPRAKGKYIALCEGDDYWIDPLKLQKQADFMEAHPDYAMCFGNAITHWENSDKPDKPFSNIDSRDYDSYELSVSWLCPTASVMFRKEVTDTVLFKRFTSNHKIIVGDLPLWVTCATVGKIRGFSDVFSIYRRVPTGFLLSRNATDRIKLGDYNIEFYNLFGKKYKTPTIHSALVNYRLAWCYARKEKNVKDGFRALMKWISIYLRYPVTALKRIPIILKQRKDRLAR